MPNPYAPSDPERNRLGARAAITPPPLAGAVIGGPSDVGISLAGQPDQSGRPVDADDAVAARLQVARETSLAAAEVEREPLRRWEEREKLVAKVHLASPFLP